MARDFPLTSSSVWTLSRALKRINPGDSSFTTLCRSGVVDFSAPFLGKAPWLRLKAQIEPFDEWLSVNMHGAGDRADATFAALAGDEVVGWAKLSFWDAKPDTPFHDLTGVKRAWRGRGIARALKHTQLNWAKEQGYRHLRTAMMERNAAIQRLNEQLGYRPIAGRIVVERAIAGSSPPPAPVA